MTVLALINAEVRGSRRDVIVRDGVVVAVGQACRHLKPSVTIDCNGGAVIPGLWDHHLHLLSAAAAEESVELGPPRVTVALQFEETLRAAGRATQEGTWIRGVGYHESVAGELRRELLDSLVSDRPVRVQHCSGALWVLNTRALQMLGIDSESGQLYRSDELLRQRTGPQPPPGLEPIGRRLASYGVVGVTDATPSNELSTMKLLATAVQRGVLPQTVVVTGGPGLASGPPVAGLMWGPVKIVVPDHDLPEVGALQISITSAHRFGRPVALHCVSSVALALALAAWCETGVFAGDRIEHGSVISPGAARRIAELGLTVVTQPGFVATRGDRYLAEVESAEIPDLYRCGSLLHLGIRVGGSTDAPFGELDPWRSVRAAADRRTDGGSVLGRSERVSPLRALGLFLAPHDRPGGPPRTVSVGSAADLCVLDAPLAAALAEPSSRRVVATVARGKIVFSR